MFKVRAIRILFLTFLVILAPSLFAQATRTWVSGVGDDANPCSRTAPCKTFAGAISKTAAGGEINAIDSGGFGAVTITKSITIDGAGVLASILFSGVNGVVVNATGIQVTLRNIDFNGGGTGFSGVRILAAGTVNVEDSTFYSYTNNGIVDVRTTPGNLFVRNCVFRGGSTGQYGVFQAPASGTPALAMALSNIVATGHTVAGVRSSPTSRVYISDSSLFQNSQGVLAASTVNIERTMITENTHGLHAAAGSVARISETMIVNNTTNGVLIDAGGTVESFMNNRIRGNGAGNGAGLITVGQQ